MFEGLYRAVCQNHVHQADVHDLTFRTSCLVEEKVLSEVKKQVLPFKRAGHHGKKPRVERQGDFLHLLSSFLYLNLEVRQQTDYYPIEHEVLHLLLQRVLSPAFFKFLLVLLDAT